MNFKTTYILFCVLIGMLGLFGLMLGFKKPGTDIGYVFPSFREGKTPAAQSDIDTVEIERKDEPTLVFVRKKQGWVLHKPEIRLLGSKVNLLLQEIIEARREEDTDVRNDFKRYGLTSPAEEIILKQGGQRTWKLSLGTKSPEKGGVVYVASSDRPGEVLAVKRSNLPTLLKFKFDDLRSPKLLEASPQATRLLTITDDSSKKTKKEISLQRTPSGNYRFVIPKNFGPAEMESDLVALGGAEAKQSPGVRGLLQAIDGLEAVGFEPLEERDFAKFGVQENARGLRIHVENSKSMGLGGERSAGMDKATLLIGKRAPKTDKKKEDEYYARLLPERAVVRVPAKNVKTIRDLLNDDGQELRSLKLTQVLPSAPDAIDMHNRRGLIQLRRGKDLHWKVYAPVLGQVRTAQDTEINELLAALGAKHQIKKFVVDRSDGSLGLADSNTWIKVWVDGIDGTRKKAGSTKKFAEKLPPLKKDAKPAVTVVFGKAAKDHDLVYARREVEGTQNRVEVPAALLNKVNRDALSYLNRNLTGFAPSDVTRLVRTHGKEIHEIARDKDGQRWKLVRPEGKGQFADKDNVAFLLSKLTGLRIVKWVQVKPTQADLKKYGLDDPSLTLKVTIKTTNPKKPEVRTYQFGKQIFFDEQGKEISPPPARGVGKGQPGVYAMTKGDVFLARAQEYKDMPEFELRDRTIFRLQPASVSRLTLAGPDNAADPTQDILFEVERDGDTWKKAKPKGFDTDTDKINPLLSNLANLRLTRFVKGDLKPDYGLGKNSKGKPQWTMRFEIALQDQDKPAVLTLGKRKDDQYYAQSSTLGEEVFLVPSATFEPLFAKPPWLRYFKKTQ